MPTIIELAQAIEDSAIGVSIAESTIAFPLLEGLHLLGLALSFGLLTIADLRLLGVVLRKVPAAQVLQQLRIWVFAGFAITFVTGGLLFWSEAGRMITNTAFIAKSVLMLLAIINASIFETRIAPRAIEWGEAVRVPNPARVAAFTSLSLWLLVVLTGRLIPYLA